MRADRPNGPVLVVAHDAGGAEVVSSWVRRTRPESYYIVAEGPARSIFQRKLLDKGIYGREELRRLLSCCPLLLTGTSWGSNLELLAIAQARSLPIRSASFLDHWTNYLQRFVLDGEVVLPDEIWVGDTYAEEIAHRHFPSEKVRFEANPYFEDIIEEIGRLPKPEAPNAGLRILYVSEPIADHFERPEYRNRHPGYDEYTALAHFLLELRRHGGVVTTRLRLHPSERPDKYAVFLAQEGYNHFHYSNGTSLLQDCAWADYVVGCESMAMVIALLAGKRVFTSIPPGGRPCQLPQAQIVPLNENSFRQS